MKQIEEMEKCVHKMEELVEDFREDATRKWAEIVTKDIGTGNEKQKRFMAAWGLKKDKKSLKGTEAVSVSALVHYKVTQPLTVALLTCGKVLMGKDVLTHPLSNELIEDLLTMEENLTKVSEFLKNVEFVEVSGAEDF